MHKKYKWGIVGVLIGLSLVAVGSWAYGSYNKLSYEEWYATGTVCGGILPIGNYHHYHTIQLDGEEKWLCLGATTFDRIKTIYFVEQEIVCAPGLLEGMITCVGEFHGTKVWDSHN